MADALLLTLLGHYVPKSRAEVGELLARAKVNRVEYMLLRALVDKGLNHGLAELLSKLERKKVESREEVARLLTRFVEHGVDFMVIKEAPYPHLSVDLDVIFKTPDDFEKALPLIKGARVHVDPHVPGLREFKGAYAKVPVAELWLRSTRKKICGVAVRVPGVEDDVVLRLIHCIKHREVQLGDLLSILSARPDEGLLRQLVIEHGLSAMYSYLRYLLKYLGLEKFKFAAATPFDLVLRMQARRGASSAFPLKVPTLAVGYTAMPRL